jgi:hypothetical protein
LTVSTNRVRDGDHLLRLAMRDGLGPQHRGADRRVNAERQRLQPGQARVQTLTDGEPFELIEAR